MNDNLRTEVIEMLVNEVDSQYIGSKANEFHFYKIDLAAIAANLSDAESKLVEPLNYAFAYIIGNPVSNNFDETFIPRWVIGSNQSEPGSSQIPPQAVEIWKYGLSASESNFSKSRLADLLQALQTSNRFEYAKIAVQAYIGLWNDERIPEYELMQSIKRAFHLAKSFKLNEALEQLFKLLSKKVAEKLETLTPFSGITLDYLELSHEDVAQQAEIKNFYLRIIKEVEIDYFLRILAIERYNSIANHEERQNAAKLQMDLMLQQIAQSSKLIKYKCLTEAIEFANKNGFIETRNELQAALQNIPDSELGLTEISTSIELDADPINLLKDGWIQKRLQSQNILSFVTQNPLPSEKETEDFLDEVAEASPLLHIVNPEIIGAHNIPIHSSERWTQRDQQKLNLISIHFQIFGMAADAFLTEIVDPVEEVQKLVQLLEPSLGSTPISNTIIRACLCHKSGNHWESALISCAGLERLIRDIAKNRDISIWTTERGQTPGRVRSINEIMVELKQASLGIDLEYADKLAFGGNWLNLRNSFFHGIKLDATHIESALLLHCLINAWFVSSIPERANK